MTTSLGGIHVRAARLLIAALALAVTGPGAAASASGPAGTGAGAGAGAPGAPALFVNGYRIETSSPPVIVGGRVLVPVRDVAEVLGADVAWDAAARRVTLRHRGTEVQLVIGAAVALVNRTEIPLDVPAAIVSGRTMVPLRLVGHAFGAEVAWDEAARAVQVSLVRTRDGLTPEEVLRRSAAAGSAVRSYRVQGRYGTEIAAAETGRTQAGAGWSRTVGFSGAVRDGAMHLRLEGWDSELGATGAVELFRDGTGLWIREDQGEWTAVAAGASAGAEDPTAGDGSGVPGGGVLAPADLAKGVVPLFGEDVLLEGRRHYTVRVIVEGEDLAGSGAAGDGAGGGPDGDPAERLFAELTRRLVMVAYIDAETFLVSRVETGTEADVVLYGVPCHVRFRWEAEYSGYGAEVQMPAVPGAAAPAVPGNSLVL